jgi:hypothetical protein
VPSSIPVDEAAGPVEHQPIFVAPTGAEQADDRGPATEAVPLATLEEAQRRARSLAAQPRDVTVVLLDGIHRLRAPLRFGAADSGIDGHTVTWRAAVGANPVLSGAQPVRGWEPDEAGAGVYKAEVGTAFDTRQLYVDGLLAPRAKVRLRRDDITFTPTGFTLNDPELAYLAALPDQQRIELSASLGWTHRYAPVESISTSAIVMQQPSWDNNTFGYDTIQRPLWEHLDPVLHLENSRSFLDQPGEWYLDTTEGLLYYLPLPGQNMSEAQVELPRLETLIEIGGTYDEPARNLRFEGLVLTGGATAVGVARRLGASGIRLEGEVETGVPMGFLAGPRPYPVVTKAGGFGGPDTLVGAVEALSGEERNP